MAEETPCPLCGAPNTDNWPMATPGGARDGGCQDCWEAQCSASWWEAHLPPIETMKGSVTC